MCCQRLVSRIPIALSVGRLTVMRVHGISTAWSVHEVISMRMDRSSRVINDLSNKEFAVIENVESLRESDVDVLCVYLESKIGKCVAFRIHGAACVCRSGQESAADPTFSEPCAWPTTEHSPSPLQSSNHILLCRHLHCLLMMQSRYSVRPLSLLKDVTRWLSYCNTRPGSSFSFRPAQQNAFVHLFHK